MIEERTAEVAELHARVAALIEGSNGHHLDSKGSVDEGHGIILDDQALIDKAMASRNGMKFAALWAGDTSAYGSDDSAADLALCHTLAFWTGRDPARMDRLFRQSGLMRTKWNARRGAITY